MLRKAASARICLYSLYLAAMALSFSIFTHRLEHNPPGFFIDEAIYGFEAYSILNNGGRSSSDELWPRLFLNPGAERRDHGIYTYLVMPFIRVLGMNEFAVRFTSVFGSLSLLICIIVLSKSIASTTSIALATPLWPITSWAFLLSRIGMEFIWTALLFTLALILLHVIHTDRAHVHRNAFLLSIVLAMLFYVYAAGKVMAPALLALGILFLLRDGPSRESLAILLVPFSLAALLSLPYIIDASFFYRFDELKECETSPAVCLLGNLLSHFDYRSYFADTYVPHDFYVFSHSISGTSLVPRYLSPFLILGLSAVVYRAIRRNDVSLLLLAAVFVASVPSSLTIRGFDSYRSVALLPLIFIFIIGGVDIVMQLLARLPNMILGNLCLLLISIAIFYLSTRELNTLFAYEYNTEAATRFGWEFGTKEIFNYFIDHYHEYDAFRITEDIAFLPRLYVRFYDPRKEYSKIQVGGIDQARRGSVLYAVRPGEISREHLLLRKIIYYPNGHDEAL